MKVLEFFSRIMRREGSFDDPKTHRIKRCSCGNKSPKAYALNLGCSYFIFCKQCKKEMRSNPLHQYVYPRKNKLMLDEEFNRLVEKWNSSNKLS